MAKVLRKCLPANVLEMISNIIGDTEKGLTGSEIHRFLLQANIEDMTQEGVMMAKRKNLFNSLANNQNKNKCSNHILIFIALVNFKHENSLLMPIILLIIRLVNIYIVLNNMIFIVKTKYISLKIFIS